MVMHNTHQVTEINRQRVSDLAISGIPRYLIAEMMKIDPDTLVKYYLDELTCAQADVVRRIGKTVVAQAEAGNEKSQALYLKTQGAKYGWVEKQVVENVSNEETNQLKDKLKELEAIHQREY